MSITNGPNLGLMVNGNQGEGHYSQFMAFLRGVDGLVMPSVKGYLTNTPPASPADGDCYIIGAAPSGAWAGQAGKVTRYSSTMAAWEFYAPKNGWMLQANSARETYRYTGGAWEIYYQEGTWTPVATGMNPAGGTPVYSGTYAKIGSRVDFVINIGGTGTTAPNGAGTSYLSLPFTPARNGVCHVNGLNGTITGVGLVVTSAFAMTPAWTASNPGGVLAGVIFLF